MPLAFAEILLQAMPDQGGYERSARSAFRTAKYQHDPRPPSRIPGNGAPSDHSWGGADRRDSVDDAEPGRVKEIAAKIADLESRGQALILDLAIPRQARRRRGSPAANLFLDKGLITTRRPEMARQDTRRSLRKR